MRWRPGAGHHRWSAWMPRHWRPPGVPPRRWCVVPAMLLVRSPRCVVPRSILILCATISVPLPIAAVPR